MRLGFLLVADIRQTTTRLLSLIWMRDIDCSEPVTIMTRDGVLERLRLSEAELRARGVAHAALFRSLARGGREATSTSWSKLAPHADARMGIFKYAGNVNLIEDMFSMRVDISNRAALKSHVRPNAGRDAVYAF